MPDMQLDQTPIDTTGHDNPDVERRTLRVLLVTTWETACGIAEHSAMLRAAVEEADGAIVLHPCPDALDPYTTLEIEGSFDVLHLNYHAALHSRWTPLVIRAWKVAHPGVAVVVTYHDTGVPNSDQCRGVGAAADAMIVHEPFDDLPTEKTYYWRMGVQEDPTAPLPTLGSRDRPYLGTVGFPFGWKCYDELCRVTAAIGWGLLLIAPGATPDDRDRWQRLNPFVSIVSEFPSRTNVIARLRGCDATAFTYVCHNTGQSGAILLGVAAGKPVIALRTCRQMRALALDPLGAETILWAETFAEVPRILTHLPLTRLDAGIVALREQESWRHLGKKYAALYRKLAAGDRG